MLQFLPICGGALKPHPTAGGKSRFLAQIFVFKKTNRNEWSGELTESAVGHRMGDIYEIVKVRYGLIIGKMFYYVK